MSTTTNTTPATCPAWCTDTTGHDFGQMADGSFERYHETTLASLPPVSLFLSSTDRLTVEANGSTLTGGEPVLTLTGPESHTMTAEDARALAAALLAGADRLDAVSGSGVRVRTIETPEGTATFTGDAEAIRLSLPAGWTEAERQEFEQDARAFFKSATAAVLAGRVER